MYTIPKEKHGSVAWLQQRHRDENGNVTFGASEAAAIIGDSPYTSRAELFARKLSEPEVGVETPTFRKGNLIEPILISEASVMLGVHFFTPELLYRKGPFTATLDGVDYEHNPNIVIEAKTTARYTIRSVADLPKEWLWQGYAQQYVTGAEVYFCVLDAAQNITLHKLPDSPEAIKTLVDAAEKLAHAIETNDVSAVDDDNMSASVISKLFAPTDESVEIPTDEMFWLQQLAEAKDMINEGETLKAQAEDRIANLLRGATVGTYKGEKVVSWKQQGGRKKLDTAALRKDYPEIVMQYEKEGAPFRVMRTHNVQGRW